MIREILAIVILTLASPCAWAQIGPDQTPPVDDAGKTYFRERFLVSGFNRAFAISPSGKWAGWLGSTSERAREQAIAACEKKASQPCSLYAFDGYVLAGQDFSTIPRYADAPTLGLFIPSDYTPVLGPERAKGVIIWSHGYLAGVDATKGSPQGYVSRFHAAGWDVYRYNREYIDQMPKEIAAMIDSIKAAKAAGYRKVVLAGQSHGAWISLEAFARDAPIDGVISVSPAHHGSPPTSGARSDFRELLRQMRKRDTPDIPVVIALFQNDSFDPGGRFADIPDILGGSKIPLHYIDRPAELSGHGAGNGLPFNDRFGPCILRFVTTTPAEFGDCK
jgi:pimeloyl-ACP methyl ester carboxylesterase